ncbi:MAG: hypothetical protein KAI83_09745, partial [Thiomargarita sp.]|nr:hypothetical protein [Thiomargarita sp.]
MYSNSTKLKRCTPIRHCRLHTFMVALSRYENSHILKMLIQTRVKNDKLEKGLRMMICNYSGNHKGLP